MNEHTQETLFDIEPEQEIALLPTPQASDCYRQTSHPKNLTNFGNNPTLLGAIVLLPTPVAADGIRANHTYMVGNLTLFGAIKQVTQ